MIKGRTATASLLMGSTPVRFLMVNPTLLATYPRTAVAFPEVEETASSVVEAGAAEGITAATAGTTAATTAAVAPATTPAALPTTLSPFATGASCTLSRVAWFEMVGI